MKIWEAIPEDYENYSHVIPAKKDYNNDSLMHEWNFDIPGNYTGGKYTPIEMVKEYKGKPMCNIPYYFTGLLILDNEALNALSDLLKKSNIEILKINCKDRELHAINILDVFKASQVLDCDKTEFKYFSSGKIMYVKKYVFLEKEVASKHIFEVKEGLGTLVSDEFKQRVEQYKLIGLKFKLVWDSEAV